MKLFKVKRICPICGIEFAPKTINSRYCSEKMFKESIQEKGGWASIAQVEAFHISVISDIRYCKPNSVKTTKEV